MDSSIVDDEQHLICSVKALWMANTASGIMKIIIIMEYDSLGYLGVSIRSEWDGSYSVCSWVYEYYATWAWGGAVGALNESQVKIVLGLNHFRTGLCQRHVSLLDCNQPD